MGNYLAKNIKFLRRHYGVSQETMGKSINVSRDMISKYELGHNSPSIDNLIKISSYFNVAIDLLVKTDIKEKSKNNDIWPSNMPTYLWTKYKNILGTLKKYSKSYDLCIEITKDLEQLNY